MMIGRPDHPCIIHNYTNSNIIPLGYGINLSLLWQIKTSHTIHGYFWATLDVGVDDKSTEFLMGGQSLLIFSNFSTAKCFSLRGRSFSQKAESINLTSPRSTTISSANRQTKTCKKCTIISIYFIPFKH